MKSNQNSRPASNARGTSAHGQRPAVVLPGVSSFPLPRMVKRLAVGAIILVAAGAFGGNALAAQAGKAADGAASRESLLKADHAFSEAAAKADRAAAAPLLGPRFTWTNRDGKTWSRTQALTEWKTLAATAGNESGFDARVYGMVGLVTGMGKVGDHDVRFGRIWIKGPAGWETMGDQANPVLPAEGAAAPAARRTESPPRLHKTDRWDWQPPAR